MPIGSNLNPIAPAPWLRQRWQAGETGGKTLLKETKQMGDNGSYTILVDLLISYPKTAGSSTLPTAEKGLTYSNGPPPRS